MKIFPSLNTTIRWKWNCNGSTKSYWKQKRTAMEAEVPVAIKAQLVAKAPSEVKARIKEDPRLCQIFCSRG